MKIAIDLDEVLSNTMGPLCEFHNKKYKTNLKPKDFFSYEWEKVWGGTSKDTVKKWIEFISENGEKLPVKKNALISVKELSKENELYVISARQNEIKKLTINWIEKNFPNYFKKILLANNYAIKGKELSKKELCEKEKIDILIEDQLKHSIGAVSKKRKVILFNYPWNKHTNLPKNIFRVNNWSEVTKLIKNNFQ